MPETPLYYSFVLKSPWIGVFHFFVRDLRYYREALDAGAELAQPEKIKQIERSAYDMSFREACRQAEKP